MEFSVFTDWARGQILFKNNFLPFYFHKPRKVFLMPYTDTSKGITYINYFGPYRARGLSVQDAV